MPRDTQIVRSALRAAPKDYTIDKSVELILRSVHAQFRDDGAGSDWLPCVDLISDSGHTIARCVDPNVVVTAGDDAEVTWFPDVKPAGAAAPTSTVLAYAQGFSEFTTGDPVQTVLAGTASNGTNAHATTTAPGILSWSTTVHTNDTLNFGASGTYLVWASSLWDTSDIALTTTIMNTGVTGFRHDPFLPSAFSAFVASDGLANSQDYDVFHVGLGAGSTHVIHQNGLGVDHGVEAQFLTAVFLGTG